LALKKTILITGAIAIVVFVAWSFLMAKQDAGFSNQQVSRLEHMGDECIGISDKAIIGLNAVVEFQKQEILSRKANVMKRCMADRGFHENIAWRESMTPIAKANAAKQAISFDEAIENMRKVDMWVFKKQGSHTLYWVSD
jgi:hypothetical protein